MVKSNTHTQAQAIEGYYKLHSPIYDATRWSFLFGRRSLIKKLPSLPSHPRILEVGCGTGENIEHLRSYYPAAHITGIDISPDMLFKASKKISSSPRVKLINGNYGTHHLESKSFDLIFFSYSLTMMGENIHRILQQAAFDLAPNGYIAVVDFHTSPFSWFRNWMKANHVIMNGSLLSGLNNYYNPRCSTIHKAYLGWWSYFLFIGQEG